MDRVERFLAALRRSNPNAVELYTQGQCYNLFLLLREIFPSAKPFYVEDPGQSSEFAAAIREIAERHGL